MKVFKLPEKQRDVEIDSKVYKLNLDIKVLMHCKLMSENMLSINSYDMEKNYILEEGQKIINEAFGEGSFDLMGFSDPLVVFSIVGQTAGAISEAINEYATSYIPKNSATQMLEKVDSLKAIMDTYAKMEKK